MLILKAYKFRIYPNKNQQIILSKVFNDTRFVWNQLVGNFNSFGSAEFKERFSEKEIKEEYSFLDDSISYALQQKRIDFESTKSQFFNKSRKKALGRMKFKKKGVSSDSFRIPAQALTNPFDFENKTIKLTKLGKVKCKFDRIFKGNFKNVTVSKDKTGKFFVSVLIEEEFETKLKNNQAIGLDLGLKELLTLSDGTVFENLRFFRENQSKLSKNQRHLSRKTRGSTRYNKQKLKVTKVHQKIKNQREWYIHNITSLLVNNYDLICIEDLNVQGMKSRFGKSVSDASFSTLVNQLMYKSQWNGSLVKKVHRFYPSSKTCSQCGNIKSELSLSERVYCCEECGLEMDRDLNASKNILSSVLEEMKNDKNELNSDEHIEYSRREEIRLEEVCNIHPLIASSMKRLRTV